jgi:hypothetical protein
MEEPDKKFKNKNHNFSMKVIEKPLILSAAIQKFKKARAGPLKMGTKPRLLCFHMKSELRKSLTGEIGKSKSAIFIKVAFLNHSGIITSEMIRKTDNTIKSFLPIVAAFSIFSLFFMNLLHLLCLYQPDL